ncbi:MAG TPA: SDR family NAD(P)-dependent oxidoreductase [Jiangellales bacterium]|nr:SDR family NAD(P)-dependent oxidoreductase [Jiangellales bacterium]
MDEFEGKVAVVTGAGSGMGKAFAMRFAAEGMKVVAADIQKDALAQTVQALRVRGTEVLGVHTDVSSAESVNELAEATQREFGDVHLLCNNAGVEGYLDGAIWEATEKDWAWTVGVNFWSVVHGLKAFLPGMLAHGQPGHVVNTCSMTSVIAAGNMYAITKQAVIALTEVLASDLRAREARIGVTALCPGIIATNLFRGSRNRPESLRNEGETPGTHEGREIRDRLHAALAEGMSPAEVAEKLVQAIRSNSRYLLTDHAWDHLIIDRHEAILAGAVGPIDVQGVTR